MGEYYTKQTRMCKGVLHLWDGMGGAVDLAEQIVRDLESRMDSPPP